ncbi:hypothetical protein, partial [Leuconostoc mesenteroides]|uniref:hypothetical protein n=3 Tax=Leuconostoc mesenteroides TaxID=1245 RepID=UPI00235E5823
MSFWTTGGSDIIGLSVTGIGDGGNVLSSMPKFESGTIATDWTPAPEDIDNATAKAQLTADQATTSLNDYKTDADGRISKAQSDIIQTAKDVTTKVSQSDYNSKTSELTTKVSTVQQTADSVVTTIGLYKTSNDNRVSAAETKISQNTDDIILRATKSDLDAAASDYTTKVAQVQLNVDSVTTSVSNINSKVNNLSVGGRNLLLGTSNDLTILPVTDGSWKENFNFVQIYDRLEPRKEYTFSSEISLSGTSDKQVSIKLFDSSIQTELLSNNSFVADGTRQSWTFTAPDNGTTLLVYAGVAGSTLGITANYHYSKLETGNVPTNWTPAPEDVDSKFASQQITIDGITDTVSNQGTNISNLTSRVQTAEGTLSTATDNISGMQTKITQTSNQISQEITDRANGDSNTLQSSKDFTTSQITN